MRAFAGVASCVLFCLASAIFGLPKVNLIAAAQPIPKSLEEGGAENALRARKNQWTVGVAGGQFSGTYMIFADELARLFCCHAVELAGFTVSTCCTGSF